MPKVAKCSGLIKIVCINIETQRADFVIVYYVKWSYYNCNFQNIMLKMVEECERDCFCYGSWIKQNFDQIILKLNVWKI